MNRRAFLGLLAAAPVAAVVPPRTPTADVWYALPAPSALERELVEWQRAMLDRMINPPIVVDASTMAIRPLSVTWPFDVDRDGRRVMYSG